MFLLKRIASALPVCAAASFLAIAPAHAFDPPGEPSAGVLAASGETVQASERERGWIFDEVRLGGSAFLKGDVPDDETGGFINGQVLFDPLWGSFGNIWLDAALRPRPHLGGTVALGDGTDQIFGGVTWNLPVTRYFFLEASFGGTIHDGHIEGVYGESQSLGCRVLFRESAGVGVNLGDHWRVIAAVDHSSHASLCSDQNAGLSHVGASVGYRF